MTDPGGAIAAAYDRFAAVYSALFEHELDTRPDERRLMARFAEAAGSLTPRRIVDVGCGPGHVMAWVAQEGRRHGATTIGVDASSAMALLARRHGSPDPAVVGSSHALPFDAATHSGVLSRHAMIHTPPDQLTDSIEEFARVLVPGGWLLTTFSAAGERGHGEPFDHKVATAYRWNPDDVESLFATAGFVEITEHHHTPQHGDRFRHISLLARIAESPKVLRLGRE